MIQNDSQNFKDIQLYPVSEHAGPRILQASQPAAGSSLDVELIDAGVSRWVSSPSRGPQTAMSRQAYLLWRPVAIQLLHCRRLRRSDL